MRTMGIVRKVEKADITEGSLHSHLQRSVEKTINAGKSNGIECHLCSCHSESDDTSSGTITFSCLSGN